MVGEPLVGVAVNVNDPFIQMLAEEAANDTPITFKVAASDVTEEQGEDPLTITRY
jgi:hypothetical protein